MAMFVIVFFFVLPIVLFADILISFYFLIFKRPMLLKHPVLWLLNFGFIGAVLIWGRGFILEVPTEMFNNFGGPRLVVQLPLGFSEESLTLHGDWAESKEDQVLEVSYDSERKKFSRFRVFFPGTVSLNFASKTKFLIEEKEVEHHHYKSGSTGPEGLEIEFSLSPY